MGRQMRPFRLWPRRSATPEAFFAGVDLDEVDEDEASFRSLKSMNAHERNAALAAASVAFLLSDYVDDEFRLPEPSLFDTGSCSHA
jgi:hypothetical protein